MKNQIIQLDKKALDELSLEVFMNMCGYNTGKNVPQKKIDRSLRSLDDIYDQLEIRVLISEYEKSCFDGVNIRMDNAVFTCQELNRIPTKTIEKIYIYMLTAGVINIDQASVLNRVYYDMWQNAYIDAGQELLRNYLSQLKCNARKYITNSFGPGLYGMEVSQLEQVFSVMAAELIHMELLDSGFMSPLKSCAGFFMVTDSLQDFAAKNCDGCMYKGKKCIYCKAERKMA